MQIRCAGSIQIGLVVGMYVFFHPSLWAVNEFLFMSLEIEIDLGLK